MAVAKSRFGKAKDGQELELFTLTNRRGVSVKITNLGATLVSVIVPDREGNMRDVLLGCDNPEGYYENSGCFGAVIGRNGNRIEKGRFSIGGKTYQMDINDNENNLHSGRDGFEHRVWTVKAVGEDYVCLGIKDEDGRQGFPGNFEVTITYTLREENELILHYEGHCDQDTVANMTNHAYFNLAGHDSGTVLDQELTLMARAYTPVRDSQMIPTGEIAPVEGTPMDFTVAKPIGRDIGEDFQQLNFAGGYDHNYVIKKEKGELERCARAYSPSSGICMEVFTDLPGVQFYAGNGIEPHIGKNGAAYTKWQGFCLETQYYPNSVNQAGFEKPLLRAGEKYDTMTIYKFSKA